MTMGANHTGAEGWEEQIITVGVLLESYELEGEQRRRDNV